MAATRRCNHRETGRSGNVNLYLFGTLKISPLSWCIQPILLRGWLFPDLFLVFFPSRFPFFFNICFYRLQIYSYFIPLLISLFVSRFPIIALCSALLLISPHNNCTVIKQCLSHQTIMRHGVNPLFSLVHTDGFSYVVRWSTWNEMGGWTWWCELPLFAQGKIQVLCFVTTETRLLISGLQEVS